MKVRDGHQVRNKAAHLAVGVDLDGIKHVLGIWVQTSEGAKFWAGVCAELRNRGIRDVLIVCCDGLSGFPEAIEATWPAATVQTCTVHLIRAAMRFVSYQDRKRVAAALRPIYTAPTVDAAESELLAFAESDLGRRYPATVTTWENAWERFSPFLAFPPELRKIIYTTNSIESLNYQLRKIIKNRGHFPNDDAVIKLLWLAIRDIEDKRARARAQEKGVPREQRKAPGRLVEGAVVHGWKQALGALALAYPDRTPPRLTTPCPSSTPADPFPPRQRCPRGAPAAQRGRTTWTPTSGGRQSTGEEEQTQETTTEPIHLHRPVDRLSSCREIPRSPRRSPTWSGSTWIPPAERSCSASTRRPASKRWIGLSHCCRSPST